MRKTLLTTSALVAAIAFGGAAQAQDIGVGSGALNLDIQPNLAPQSSTNSMSVTGGEALSNEQDGLSVGNQEVQSANNSAEIEVEDFDNSIALGASNVVLQGNYAYQETRNVITTESGDIEDSVQDGTSVGNLSDQTSRNSGLIDAEGDDAAVGIGAWSVSLQDNSGDQLVVNRLSNTGPFDGGDSFRVSNNDQDGAAFGNSAEQLSVNNGEVYTDSDDLGIAAGAVNLSFQLNDGTQTVRNVIVATTSFSGQAQGNEQDATTVGNAADQTARNNEDIEAETTSFALADGQFALGATNASVQLNYSGQTSINSITAARDVQRNDQDALSVGNSLTQVARNTDDVTSEDGPLAGGATNVGLQLNQASQTSTNNIDAGALTSNNMQSATAVGNVGSSTAVNTDSVSVDE